MDTLDKQLSVALSALIAALCDQPGIDPRRLQADYLASAEGFAGGPTAVSGVVMDIASVIEAFARRREAISGMSPGAYPPP